MAKYYSVASDGIVRAHQKDTVAMKRIRGGGRVQAEGAPSWFTYAEFKPMVDERVKRDAARRAVWVAAHIERHREGGSDPVGYRQVKGCPLCFPAITNSPTPEKP